MSNWMTTYFYIHWWMLLWRLGFNLLFTERWNSWLCQWRKMLFIDLLSSKSLLSRDDWGFDLFESLSDSQSASPRACRNPYARTRSVHYLSTWLLCSFCELGPSYCEQLSDSFVHSSATQVEFNTVNLIYFCKCSSISIHTTATRLVSSFSCIRQWTNSSWHGIATQESGAWLACLGRFVRGWPIHHQCDAGHWGAAFSQMLQHNRCRDN